MGNKGLTFRTLGGENSVFKSVSVEVTGLYQSRIPLLATRILKPGENAAELIMENEHGIEEPAEWSVSHYKHRFTEDRVGIRRFQLLRMDIFDQIWQKPINLREYGFQTDGTGTYYYMAGPDGIWKGQHHFLLEWDKKLGMEWVYKNELIVYPFTDRESMFENPEDEFAYIADVLNNPGGYST